jgi:site-specific recombinase XerD
MHALIDFALHGCIQRRTYVVEKIKLSDNMKKSLAGYEQFCHEQLWSPSGTIRPRMRHVTRFLHYLNSHGIVSVMEIEEPILSRFVTSYAHLKPATIANFISSIRSFLRYLYMIGGISVNLVEHLPKIRIWSDAHIPSS